MNSLSNLIRKVIDDRNLSVSGLADGARLSRTYVTDVLRGRYVPKDDRVVMIAEVLGLKPDVLLKAASDARMEIKAAKPTRSSKFIEQRRAKSLASVFSGMGITCILGENPPLVLKLRKKSYGVLFTQPKADHRWTLGSALEIKERSKFNAVYVIPELRTDDDLMYADLMKKYGVCMRTAEELISELKGEMP
jgi:transcriptional regulator with XRE-family HTH domain